MGLTILHGSPFFFCLISKTCARQQHLPGNQDLVPAGAKGSGSCCLAQVCEEIEGKEKGLPCKTVSTTLDRGGLNAAVCGLGNTEINS